MARDMEHGEEIDHTDVVAPFACRGLNIPEALDVFASQCTILLIVAVGQCKGSYGVGTGHALSVVACGF